VCNDDVGLDEDLNFVSEMLANEGANRMAMIG
jgi:hypothetical protein